MLLVLAVLQCVAGDLAAGRQASGAVAQGDPRFVVSGIRIVDGAPFNAPGAVLLRPDEPLVVDLGEPRPIGALLIQADDNDSYVIEGSTDQRAWTALWTAPPSQTGAGLRTRRTVLDARVEVRWLRVLGRGGDGIFSVGRLEAYCDAPPEWPRPPALWDLPERWRLLDNEGMVAFKGALAAAGALLLLVGVVLTWRGRAHLLRRTRDALLAFLGILSFAAWFNLGHFHFPNYIHPWDTFHYYIGAKYFPELGYSHIYECTLIAEAERYGPGAVAGRTIRNLHTNRLEPAAPVVADPTRCTSRFTPERWRAFGDDMVFFRNRFVFTRWEQVLHDHGYNGTPVWGLAGGALANLGPATERQVLLLDLVDPALLVVMWAVVAWAFGWRAACVALLFWGTNFPARFWWNGGSFLRMDWLCLAIIGICLVKRDRPAAGGAALAASALLRVFPGFIVGGLLLKIAAESLRARRVAITRAQRRFVLGAVVAGAALVGAAAVVSGHGPLGAGAFVDFAENSKKHLDTPLTNNMGWKTVVAYDRATRAQVMVGGPGDDPYAAWKEARRVAFHERHLLFYAALAGFLLLVAWAAGPLPDWAALVLGVGIIAFASELTCYYYSFLLAFGFLWTLRPIIGVGLCALAAATTVTPILTSWDDVLYTDASAHVLVFVVAVTLFLSLQRYQMQLDETQPQLAPRG